MAMCDVKGVGRSEEPTENYHHTFGSLSQLTWHHFRPQQEAAFLAKKALKPTTD